MDKPRAFIHHRTTRQHSDLGVLAIGRFHLPLVVPSILITVVLGLELIVGLVMMFWINDLSPMYPLFWTVAVLACVGALVGVVALITWTAQTIRRANLKERW